MSPSLSDWCQLVLQGMMVVSIEWRGNLIIVFGEDEIAMIHWGSYESTERTDIRLYQSYQFHPCQI